MKKIMTKWDKILVISILLFGIVLAIVFKINSKPGDYVIVSIDGKQVDRFSLYDEIDKNYDIEGNINILTIRNRQVSVTEANCKDGLCVKQGWISHSHESIVCLPHKFVVTIDEKEATDVDAVSR